MTAFLMRIWGIDYDLPYIYHPDEPMNIGVSHRIFSTGDLNPHFFNYPSLFFYINALGDAMYYYGGKLAGFFQTPGDLLPPLSLAMGVTEAPLPGAILFGRLTTVIFGLGSVLLVFAIGRRLSGHILVALLAALILAVSPTNIALNRFITPDSYVVFFVLAAFLASLMILQKGGTRYYVTAGLIAGLAISSKYSSALVLLVLLGAHFLRHGRAGFGKRDLYLALVACALGFALTTPFALLDFAKFWADMRFETQHYTTGHAGMEGDTLRWYLRYLWDTTGIITILAVIAIGWGVYKRSKNIFLLAIFPVTYFVFISRFVVRNDRTIMPLIPFLFLLTAWLLGWLLEHAQKTRVERTRVLSISAICVLAAVSIALPTTRTVADTIKLTTPNSRETARVWLDANLPPGARVALESYAPFVDPQRFTVQGFGRMIDHPAQWYVDNGFQYLIFSQGMYGRFYRARDPYQDQVAQYDELFRRFTLLKVFTDGGYQVQVFRVTPQPEP